MNKIKLLWLAAIALLATLPSCKSRAKKCNDCLKLAVEYGCLDLDSSKRYVTKLIKGDSIHHRDSIYVPKEVITRLQGKDTCYTRWRIKETLQSAVIKPVDTSLKAGRLKIWLKNGEFDFQFIENNTLDTTAIYENNPVIKPLPEGKKEFDWWKLAFFCLLGGYILTVIYLLRKNT